MGSTLQGIDPEVIALLDEVIADPSSALVRPPKRPLSEVWGLREPPISASTPSLSKLERHLLQRKREEVAELLFQASKVAMEGAPYFWSVPPDLDNWRARLRAAEIDELASESGRLTAFLTAPERSVRATELASASLRVVPNDRARIQYALALNHEGEGRLALRVLHDVLGGHPGTRDLSNARANCGMVYGRSRAFEQAREWYRFASLSADARPFSKLYWLVLAARSGHEIEATEASRLIEDSVAPDEGEVEEVVAQLRSDVLAGHWAASKNSARVVSTLCSRANEMTARLMNVVA